MSQSGAEAGESIDLRVTSGTHLEELDSLHFSHPAIHVDPATLDPLPYTDARRPHHGHFSVTVPDSIPAGRYEVRVKGRHGISNPRAFLVTRFANAAVPSVSHDSNSPTALPPATLVHARSTAAEIDYFTLEVEAGKQLRIELVAQQVDSRMIGQLKLYDFDGRIVAASRGADDVDPVIEIDQVIAGRYVLEVHDFLYRGGEEFFYQLLARDGDQFVSPVVGNSSVPGQLPDVWAPWAFTVSDDANLDTPTSSTEPATIDVPGRVVEWFPSDGSDSVFQFAATQGEALAIDVLSHRGGEPTDPRLIVQRIEPQQSGPPKLHDVLNIDDSQSVSDGALVLFSRDPVALFQPPATANYLVRVRDLDTGQSLSFQQRFALQVKKPDPGFDLIAYRITPHRDVNQTRPFGSKLFRGGAESIRVLVVRRDGWSGPIKVSADSLPEGVTSSDVWIAANQAQAVMTVTASEDAKSVTGPVSIVGQSVDGSVTNEVTPAVISWGKGGGRDFVRARMASNLQIAVSDKDLSPLSMTWGDGKVDEVKKGTTLTIPVKLTRREGGKTPVVLRARDLPNGVTAGDVTIAADKNEADYALNVTPGTANGTYSLWLQAETKIKIKPNPQSLERAQQYRAHLQSLHDDPAKAADLESIKAAIAEADKSVEAAKGAANDVELTVFIPTPNATIRVVDP